MGLVFSCVFWEERSIPPGLRGDLQASINADKKPKVQMPAYVHALLLDGLQASGGVTAHGSCASRESWGWQRGATTVWLSSQINLGASQALRYLLLLRVLGAPSHPETEGEEHPPVPSPCEPHAAA